MVVFPNAKLNIGLQILGKREDGFHDIMTTMFPLPWCDVLEIVPSESFSFSQTGLTLDTSPGNNLVEQAFQLVKQRMEIPDVRIHLHKTIPSGAGLGGGSSDAAFCLKSLNALFDIGIETQQLENMAAELGSDCPFFIRNQAAVAKGRGTDLQPLTSSNRKYWIEVVVPPVHINTAWAYKEADSRAEASPISIDGDPTGWNAINDFEQAVFNAHPEIEGIKASLAQQGARYASLSGSGSTVFGIFDNRPDWSPPHPGWSGWMTI